MIFQLKKNDIVLMIIAILVSGIALWFLSGRDEGSTVEIASKEGTAIYNLSENREIKIKENGDNVIRIENGEVSMVEADCRDQICVKHKPIHLEGETIICLPNEVFITIKTGKKNDIDN